MIKFMAIAINLVAKLQLNWSFYSTKTGSEASLLNKSSCLAAALGVTKFTVILAMHLVTLCCAAWVWFRCSTNHLRGRFVELMLMLSSNFQCDQIHNKHTYDLSHTLFSCLSPTLTFNKPTSGCWQVFAATLKFLEEMTSCHLKWWSPSKVSQLVLISFQPFFPNFVCSMALRKKNWGAMTLAHIDIFIHGTTDVKSPQWA